MSFAGMTGTQNVVLRMVSSKDRLGSGHLFYLFINDLQENISHLIDYFLMNACHIGI